MVIPEAKAIIGIIAAYTLPVGTLLSLFALTIVVSADVVGSISTVENVVAVLGVSVDASFVVSSFMVVVLVSISAIVVVISASTGVVIVSD